MASDSAVGATIEGAKHPVKHWKWVLLMLAIVAGVVVLQAVYSFFNRVPIVGDYLTQLQMSRAPLAVSGAAAAVATPAATTADVSTTP